MPVHNAYLLLRVDSRAGAFLGTGAAASAAGVDVRVKNAAIGLSEGSSSSSFASGVVSGDEA